MDSVVFFIQTRIQEWSQKVSYNIFQIKSHKQGRINDPFKEIRNLTILNFRKC